MADSSVKAAKIARVLAMLHIIVGFLLICFDTADRFFVGSFWTRYGYFGIWIGVWMCIAGGLGIPGTRTERSSFRNAFAGVFMGFSITSAVFGGAISICYSTFIAINYQDRYDAVMALSAIMLILGTIEFATGIWAAACLCAMKPCTCCYGDRVSPLHQRQVMYTDNRDFVMTQATGGGPVAVPMQAGCDRVAVQTLTPGAQGGQPQMVMVPVSGTEGYQPQLNQSAPAGSVSTGNLPRQAEMPS